MGVESYKFRYHGVMRHVDNVTWEGTTLIGMEVRKAGHFSWQIKRYKLVDITDMEAVEPMRTEEQYAQAH